MRHNPVGTMLDFLLASGRTYISIHDLKFPELSAQSLCNNNSCTRPWKHFLLSLMSQSEWMLEYIVFYFYIYRYNGYIYIKYTVQWATVTTERQ